MGPEFVFEDLKLEISRKKFDPSFNIGLNCNFIFKNGVSFRKLLI